MHNPAIVHKGKAELAEYRTLEIESEILEQCYEPLWFYYYADLSDHKDVAVFIRDGENRIECLDSAADKDVKDGTRGQMSQMVAEFISDDETYRIGVKQREPGESYAIGIDKPNGWGEHHSILSAFNYNKGNGVYTDMHSAVMRLSSFVSEICAEKIVAQWLTIGGREE